MTPSKTATAEKEVYWNRENSKEQGFDDDAPLVKNAKIISLTDINDKSNDLVNNGAKTLPDGAELVAVGGSVEDFDVEMLRERGANVIFVSHPASKEPLAMLLRELPDIVWCHTRSAGIDFVLSPTFQAWQGGVVTNAKGCFSSTLAEYTLMACSFFAKDLPRLLKNKNNKNWDKYDVLELRGATLGIFGYGDIGRAAARLAVAYGMKTIALRRNPDRATAEDDALCETVYGNDSASINRLFAESD